MPEELSRCRNSYIEQALVPPRMEDLLDDSHSYRSLVKESMDALLKEAKEKFKGYDTCSTPEHAELAYKKVRRARSLARVLSSRTVRVEKCKPTAAFLATLLTFKVIIQIKHVTQYFR